MKYVKGTWEQQVLDYYRTGVGWSATARHFRRSIPSIKNTVAQASRNEITHPITKYNKQRQRRRDERAE